MKKRAYQARRLRKHNDQFGFHVKACAPVTDLKFAIVLGYTYLDTHSRYADKQLMIDHSNPSSARAE